MELKELRKAVDEFFKDTSRPIEETMSGLHEVHEDIEMKLSLLRGD